MVAFIENLSCTLFSKKDVFFDDLFYYYMVKNNLFLLECMSAFVRL